MGKKKVTKEEEEGKLEGKEIMSSESKSISANLVKQFRPNK
mgnify:CR=1 FL=1